MTCLYLHILRKILKREIREATAQPELDNAELVSRIVSVLLVSWLYLRMTRQ